MINRNQIQNLALLYFSPTIRYALISWIFTSAAAMLLILVFASASGTAIHSSLRTVAGGAIVLMSISLLFVSHFILREDGQWIAGEDETQWIKQRTFLLLAAGWVAWSVLIGVTAHWLLAPGFLLVCFLMAARAKVAIDNNVDKGLSAIQADSDTEFLAGAAETANAPDQLDTPPAEPSSLKTEEDAETNRNQFAIHQDSASVQGNEFIDQVEEFPADVIQQITRMKNEMGESIVAYVRQRLEEGQSTSVIHVPFHPPMTTNPAADSMQIEGPEVRVRITHVNRFGIRAECRLPQTPTQPVDILLEFSLTESAATRLPAAG